MILSGKSDGSGSDRKNCVTENIIKLAVGIKYTKPKLHLIAANLMHTCRILIQPKMSEFLLTQTHYYWLWYHVLSTSQVQ